MRWLSTVLFTLAVITSWVFHSDAKYCTKADSQGNVSDCPCNFGKCPSDVKNKYCIADVCREKSPYDCTKDSECTEQPNGVCKDYNKNAFGRCVYQCVTTGNKCVDGKKCCKSECTDGYCGCKAVGNPKCTKDSECCNNPKKGQYVKENNFVCKEGTCQRLLKICSKKRLSKCKESSDCYPPGTGAECAYAIGCGPKKQCLLTSDVYESPF